MIQHKMSTYDMNSMPIIYVHKSVDIIINIGCSDTIIKLRISGRLTVYYFARGR